jgi:Ca-activated chloride channel homolog
MRRREALGLFAVPWVAQKALAQNAPASSPAQGAQTPLDEIDRPFSTSVEEVIVPVTVTDADGRFVSDLSQKDFVVFEDGVHKPISYFSRERNQPVVVGFLMDISNTNRLHWPRFQDAAIELVLAMLPGDEKFSGYLISYGNDAEIQANTAQDPEEILERLRTLKPGGGAAMYDALYLAMTERKLVQGEPIEPRRVVIIIGDGHDSASKHGMNEVLELAQRNLVTIYGMSTMNFGFAADGEKNLERLCGETGGRVVYPLDNPFKDVAGQMSRPSDEGNFMIKVGTGGYSAELAKSLFESVAAITGEVTTQYILRYTTDTANAEDPSRAFRKIRVTVPKVPGVIVRHRYGYYPSNSLPLGKAVVNETP